MSWRPKDWDKHVKEFETNITIYLPNKMFEAGADAILDAARKHVVDIGKEVGRDDLEFRVRVAAWLCG